MQVISQAYKLASNEYRLFPIRVEVKLCKGIAADILGISTMKRCGNFTGCAFVKDRTYHTCNNVVKQEKLPPFLPTGDFMLEWTFMFKDVELYVVHAYGRVYRNFVAN
ncbi:hypothetical protein ILUMI_19788 [Ignelater luminosus]|uniref:Uncharacterized protein n=1 Tax=Ignelater luminosus TaxID=2038154 RepID=A0A8K0CFI3_IGNLU|nr:hypothetical protein ILUMI_19788 [Ignelater luminosus]